MRAYVFVERFAVFLPVRYLSIVASRKKNVLAIVYLAVWFEVFWGYKLR